LGGIEPDRLTPLEALRVLTEWKKRLTAEEVVITNTMLVDGKKRRGKDTADSPELSLFD